MRLDSVDTPPRRGAPRPGVGGMPGTWAVLGVALLLSACSAPGASGAGASTAAAGTRQFGSLTLEPCSVGDQRPVRAFCGSFDVPEDRQQVDGRTIALNIALLDAQEVALADPVFFLAGGPGQAATEHAFYVNAALREVRKQRHVVLVDQRGTGRSNPLDCLDASGEPLEFDGSAGADTQALQAFARRCAASLDGRADPRFYTTTDAIADLDAVRVALGADRINLVGASYGTRVAQQYAGRYPQHTRSIVLDGVAGNALVVGGEFANTFENALRLQSGQCAADEACRDRFGGDLAGRLRELLATLEARPVEVEYRDASTGEALRDTVTADTVAGLAFAFSYAPQTASLLPLVLDEAGNGRYAPLLALANLMNHQFAGQINRGMQWSVICAEDADRHVAPADDTTILGAEVAAMFFAACDVWPHGRRPAAFTAPLATDHPVLLLSGELDPVTPPAYAEAVADHLPNARHLVLTGQAHGTLVLGCTPRLVAQFIESADATGLNVECLDSLTPVLPFTSFNGWAP